MFESTFGISRETFLRKHVVPAHEDDRYMNEKCMVCWGTYDEEHPAVRILPCGHVFGRDCVSDMVKGQTGCVCPLCKTTLFRPSLTQLIAQYDELLQYAMLCLCLIVLGRISMYIPYVVSTSTVTYIAYRSRHPVLDTVSSVIILWLHCFVLSCLNFPLVLTVGMFLFCLGLLSLGHGWIFGWQTSSG